MTILLISNFCNVIKKTRWVTSTSWNTCIYFNQQQMYKTGKYSVVSNCGSWTSKFGNRRRGSQHQYVFAKLRYKWGCLHLLLDGRLRNRYYTHIMYRASKFYSQKILSVKKFSVGTSCQSGQMSNCQKICRYLCTRKCQWSHMVIS
jgi:hypothetical protein